VSIHDVGFFSIRKAEMRQKLADLFGGTFVNLDDGAWMLEQACDGSAPGPSPPRLREGARRNADWQSQLARPLQVDKQADVTPL
jgi:hypothetical protein